jgi:hypothetical protein
MEVVVEEFLLENSVRMYCNVDGYAGFLFFPPR